MQKIPLIAGMTLALMVASCSEPGPQITITSDSGDAVLVLDADALPAGVDAVSVKITKEETAEGARYQLEPDGLVLREPGTLTITEQGNVVPWPMLHVSAKGEEMEVVDTNVSIDLEKGTTETSVKVPHFSSYYYSIGSVSYRPSLEVNPAEQTVGRDIAASVSLTRPDVQTYISYRDRTTDPITEVSVVMIQLPVVAGEMGWPRDTVLRPPVFPDSPARMSMEATTVSFNRTFTCARIGESTVRQVFNVEYRGYVSIQAFADIDDETGKYINPIGEPRRRDTRRFKHKIEILEGVTCIGGSSSSSTSSSASSASQGATVSGNCLILGGEHYPVDQFRSGDHAEGCDAAHWHADVLVGSLEGSAREDPAPRNCGFGKVAEVPVEPCQIPADLLERLRRR